MFVNAYLDTAVSLIDNYNGQEPFHLYLKKQYGHLKKLGARDRRFITQLCYSWFRAGRALRHLEQREQFVYALFLCSEAPNGLLEKLNAPLNENATKKLNEKIKIVQEQVSFQPVQLFPWQAELSAEIEKPAFDQSFLIQPNLYLRLRPGKEDAVTAALQQHNISFEKNSAHCVAIENGAKIEAAVQLDKDAVVQDKNSQRVLELLSEHGVLKKFTAWDCCAASGGKSLLLLDTFSNVQLTVSDVRETILHNLRKRFQNAGVKNYRWFICDAAAEAPPHGQKFDVILCDAPCSGSGTWGRTPEQLHYFQTEKIEQYARLQQRVVRNVSRYLKPNGVLLYSTCSVFQKENEDVVQFIVKNCGLNFFKSAYYKGYSEKADTLFAALFTAS